MIHVKPSRILLTGDDLREYEAEKVSWQKIERKNNSEWTQKTNKQKPVDNHKRSVHDRLGLKSSKTA